MSRWLWTAELWTPVLKSVLNIAKRVGVPRHRIVSRKGFSFLAREGCRSLRSAFDSICRILSRVTLNDRPDLFERVLGPVAHAEAHLQDLLLSRRQRLQDPARLVLEVRDEHGLDRRQDLAVLDEVSQMRIFLLADRASRARSAPARSS